MCTQSQAAVGAVLAKRADLQAWCTNLRASEPCLAELSMLGCAILPFWKAWQQHREAGRQAGRLSVRMPTSCKLEHSRSCWGSDNKQIWDSRGRAQWTPNSTSGLNTSSATSAGLALGSGLPSIALQARAASTGRVAGPFLLPQVRSWFDSAPAHTGTCLCASFEVVKQ